MFRATFYTALLCNGSTADSGSVCQGSSPCGATKKVEIVSTFFSLNNLSPIERISDTKNMLIRTFIF